MRKERIDELLAYAVSLANAKGYATTKAAKSALRKWLTTLDESTSSGLAPDPIHDLIARLMDALLHEVVATKAITASQVGAAIEVIETESLRNQIENSIIENSIVEFDSNETDFSYGPIDIPAGGAAGGGGNAGFVWNRIEQASNPSDQVRKFERKAALPGKWAKNVRKMQSDIPVRAGLQIPPTLEILAETETGNSEPPRAAYALVDAPDTVIARKKLDVKVGLSPVQGPGVVGGELILPSDTVYPYVLSVQLVAEGFKQIGGGSWRQEITATADAPYPTTTFHLRANSQTDPVLPRALQVIYSIGGQTIGFAVRPVAVLASATAGQATTPATKAIAVDISIPTDAAAPDLTIHILRDRKVPGLLLWTIESPHSSVAKFSDDAEAASSNIGTEPDEFAKQLVQDINQEQDPESLKLLMRGIGLSVADKIPASIWEAIRAAAVVANGPPNILILSEEPYVPWELALFEEPLPDSKAPEFLGAQTNVGRWILGHTTPKLPPPHELDITLMAVVWGQYDSAKWGRLKSAEEEAAELKTEYGAASIDAKIGEVRKCLSGNPPATALHFAIHGIYNPGGIQDGLVLTDGKTISSKHVSGGKLTSHPFVFLNACQVGSAEEVLGDYAGMASAFLQVGASAVIAPLWSIDDAVAKKVSLDFYREAFKGDTVAAVVRRQRAKYGGDTSATYLAYQYFGHPLLRTTR